MSQYDLNKQKRASLLDIGQKVYQGSMEGLSTSAKNEAERIKADKAASEMRKAQRTQGIVGGIATGVAVGAVAGAATGAAVGGGLALLAFL
jgi:cysteine synthase